MKPRIPATDDAKALDYTDLATSAEPSLLATETTMSSWPGALKRGLGHGAQCAPRHVFKDDCSYSVLDAEPNERGGIRTANPGCKPGVQAPPLVVR